MICLFLISTSGFGQKTEIKKDNSITTNEIDRM
jgi:hypothetical protein